MDKKIIEEAKLIQAETIDRRRDFHRYAEPGWLEFRTASIAAACLAELDYAVKTGSEVVDEKEIMGGPTEAEAALKLNRALSQGAESVWAEKMTGGFTGVVATLKFKKPGPVVALRFDMDANELREARDAAHYPFKEKFASLNSEAMHACGHDGHTAIGLGVAKILAKFKDDFGGTVKLIFQPAEEGARGAQPMVKKGVVDDVDFFLGFHLGLGLATGKVAARTSRFFASVKLDAEFSGVSAHAAFKPEEGRNALLAAANAAINLQGISRNSKGASRVNVGVLQSGSARNIIAANALLKMETRGLTNAVNDYMHGEAVRMIEAAALMQNVAVKITKAGETINGECDADLADVIYEVAERLNIFDAVLDEAAINAGEDCVYFMERVKARGGKASYLMIGANLAAAHHNNYFDFDESALYLAAALIAATAAELLTKPFAR